MNIAQSCYKIPINADEDLTKKNKEIQIARFQDKIKFSKYDIYIMPIERQNSHICQSQYMYVLIFLSATSHQHRMLQFVRLSHSAQISVLNFIPNPSCRLGI